MISDREFNDRFDRNWQIKVADRTTSAISEEAFCEALSEWGHPDPFVRVSGPSHGYVYFCVADSGCVKVGWSTGPLFRARSLSSLTGQHTSLRATGVLSDTRLALVILDGSRERFIHGILQHERCGDYKRAEWFRGPDTYRLLTLAVTKSVEMGFYFPYWPSSPHARYAISREETLMSLAVSQALQT